MPGELLGGVLAPPVRVEYRLLLSCAGACGPPYRSPRTTESVPRVVGPVAYPTTFLVQQPGNGRQVHEPLPGADTGDIAHPLHSRLAGGGSEAGGRHPPVPAPGEEGSICLATAPGLLHEESSRGRHWDDHARHRLLVCEAIDMAARRRPHTTGGDDPPRPGPAAPWHASAQLADHPEDHGARPPGGQDQGVLGGRPGGSRRAPPSRNERAYQMAHHHKKQDHPGHRPLRPSPEQARNTQSETAPLRPGAQDAGRGRPGAPSNKTSSQRHRFQSCPRHAQQPKSAAQSPRTFKAFHRGTRQCPRSQQPTAPSGSNVNARRPPILRP